MGGEASPVRTAEGAGDAWPAFRVSGSPAQIFRADAPSKMRSDVVVVTGVGGPAGRAAFDYFCGLGYRVVSTDSRELDGYSPFHKVPAASDAGFLDALLRIVADEGAGLLVPTVSEELPLVAEHREALRERGCGLFISSCEAARIVNDKWLTAEALRASAVPVPRSYCDVTRAELLESLPPPILSKPRVGRGARGIELYRTEREIPAALPRGRIYQEFLPGEEFDVNVFADAPGVPAVVVVLRKSALKFGDFGNAAAVERVEDREVGALAEAAVRSLSLEGPLDVDVRRGASGDPAILEINGRLGANVRSAEEVLDRMTASWMERQ